jgi:ribosomal protein L37AE/L43A
MTDHITDHDENITVERRLRPGQKLWKCKHCSHESTMINNQSRADILCPECGLFQSEETPQQ